jgi:hypothetical protein
MLAEQAWLDDAPAASPGLVDKVLDKARRLLETGLDKGHIEVLEKVMAHPLTASRRTTGRAIF